MNDLDTAWDVESGRAKEFVVSFPNTKQGFSMMFDLIEHHLNFLFNQAHPNYHEARRVRTQYRRRQMARKRRKNT